MTGATGFVGSALSSYLESRGHQIVPLQRGDKPPAESFDAVIHLAGEPIGTGRWSAAKMKAILSSRVDGTKDLIRSLYQPPKIFICASAVGYYGGRGDEILNEESPSGSGFLSQVCREWESASREMQKEGVRCVQARFGIVLGANGGFLKKLLPVYRLGLGAILGDGGQWMSWVSLTDLTRALEHLLLDQEMEGPVNIVSPYPVRQEEFNKTLSDLVRRPAWLKIPRWVLTLCFGRAAEEMFLASTRVRPAKLLGAGFSFRYPQLKDTLETILLR